MSLKDMILGWLRGTPDKSGAFEAAEIDELAKEHSEERADDVVDKALGSSPDEFESDQSSPRH